MTTIGPELPIHITAIAALTEAAFASAPHSSGNESAIVAALRDAGQLHLSLVAQRDGQVVGHVAISPVSISDGSPRWYGLGPVSVLPACQQQGIGSALITRALGLLQAQGASGCVVLGEPAYYQRFGFSLVDDLVLPGVPAAYFQARAFGAAIARGQVRYPAAFAADG